MKSIIIPSLFILITSKLNAIEYGKDLTFDKDHKEFHLTPEKDGTVFIKVLYDGPNEVHFLMEHGKEKTNSSFTKPGKVFIKEVNKVNDNDFYNITLYSDSNEKGTIWFNPSWNQLKVDLNKIYEWKLDFDNIDGVESRLTYSIDNADKNVKFKFTYNKNLRQDLPNPFEICKLEGTKSNIETYDIEKGQSYKIWVKITKMKSGIFEHYYLPTFKFGDINGKWSYSLNLRINIWVISLVFLLII